LAIQVNFWPADNSNHRTVPAGFKFLEYVSKDYTIPAVKTTYADFYHNVTVDTDVHGIAFEPIFVNATQKYIHHFVIFASEVFANSGKSLDSTWSVLWAWAPGIAPFVFPTNVGMRFGPNGYKSIRFQIHYDNVNHDVGVIDSGSGVRIYYTDTLRQWMLEYSKLETFSFEILPSSHKEQEEARLNTVVHQIAANYSLGH
jgi:hypothetical protein